MHNNILDQLTDYPFDRLRALLRDVEPPADQTPIHMQIGEPRHAAPDFIGPILVESMADWGRYPPPNGPDALRAAIAEWLGNRYGLPAGMIDPAHHIAVVSGTREALFMAALLAVPEQKAGAKPVVLMPNPFYQVYIGAAAMARANRLDLDSELNLRAALHREPPTAARASTSSRTRSYGVRSTFSTRSSSNRRSCTSCGTRASTRARR